MNCYEKYYRRGYNALNKLIEAYRYGYVVANTFEFRKNLITESKINTRVMFEEQSNFIFTTMVALLGLNKESMENTGKFEEYLKNTMYANIRTQNITQDLKDRLDLFDSKRVRTTDFDSWLSILIDIPSDTTNKDHLKRVRNGLLHSNFYVDDEFPVLNIAHIKTKSYYESEILGPEFNMFIMEYFSNIEKLGLTEKIYTYDMPKDKIECREQLIFDLHRLKINEFNYENLKTVCKDTPELLLSDSTDREGIVDVRKFLNKMSNTNNYENFSINRRNLTSLELAHMFVYIEKNYGDEFFKLDNVTQSGIISTHLQYILNPKREVSNWLVHFSYLYGTLYNGRFHSEFFNGDDFGKESCYPALMILKAYLIMYRMQQNDFIELDYSKIDFDINDSKVELISENLNDSTDKTDYFNESFVKEKSKGTLTDDEVWNKIICEIVRNSLAHGNVLPNINLNTHVQEIELVDIDKKHGTKRALKMPLEVFERFLNSESFNPKYCYKKVDSVSLTRKK